jgi:Zn-dependent protease with chaperone function
MKISRISSITLYIIMGISVILTILFFAGGYVPGTKGTNIAEPVNTDYLLIWNVILLVLTLVLALGFTLVSLLMNPKQALRSLIVLLGVGVIIFISYQFSSGEPLKLVNYNGHDNIPSTLKFVDTGLFLTYFLIIVAFGAIIYNEISTALK